MNRSKKTLSIILIIPILFIILLPIKVDAAGVVYLPEGCYTFSTQLDESKKIDVKGSNIENKTNIQLWTGNNTDAQIYYITHIKSGWYSIRNLKSRKAIDVAGGVKGSGINVQLYEWNGTDAQLWRFISLGNGYFGIQNKMGYCLDVSGGKTENGNNIQVYQWNNTASQKWKITPSDGIYTFKSALNAGKCVDVNAAATDNGTNIHLWSQNNTVAQSFYISQYNGSWYSIINIASGKAIDVAGGVKGNRVNVQLYDWNKTDAQLWKFISTDDGYYYIQNKLGYYLDVNNGETRDGTNIQVYQGNGTASQKWKIIPTDVTQKINQYVLTNLYQDSAVYTSSAYENLEKLGFYFRNFNHSKKYDIKQESCWNKMFLDIKHPRSCGVKNAECCGVFKYNNMFITPEQLGNIIYGLSGSILGFSPRTIYQGGGFAANGTKYINNESMYYGDSPMDHEFISIGIKMVTPKNSIDIDISTVPSWILNLAKYILK